MQYYPPCVTPNGAQTYVAPNGGQTYPCNPFPVAQPCPWPRVLGEGRVASLALPDGSVQLYFVPSPPPAAGWPRPPHTYQNWNNPEAWFIRSMPDQFPAYQPEPNHQFQTLASPPWTQSNESKPNYQLKFHNDNWTSTTDLHYFSPPLRNWIPKQCASSQTELTCAPAAPPPPPWPNQLYVCDCYKQHGNRKRQEVPSDCDSSCSSMSVDLGGEGKPSTSSRVKKKKNKVRPSRKIQISEKPSVKCECDLQPETPKSDKAVTTYAEKMVGGGADNGRETQTACCPGTPIRRVESFFRAYNCEMEMWHPSTPLSRKAMACSDCASDADAASL